MKIAYFDCFSGISGDMILGALFDLGLKPAQLKKELNKLKLPKFDIIRKKVKRGHIQGIKVDIKTKNNLQLHSLKAVSNIIKKSKIDAGSKKLALDIFTNLAKAEAKVHKQPISKVHFHQLGEIDTIVDIVGCVLGLKILKVEKVYSSPLTIGTGTVKFHGMSFPLPAPATMELIKKRTININAKINHELITPTGAAILVTLATEIDEFLPMKVLKTGYGAGSYAISEVPNLFRVMLAKTMDSFARDNIIVLETNVDDTLPHNFEVLFERLFAAGALDVYTNSVMMKKMRPGTLLNVQVQSKDLEKILNIIFEETTTLGVRLNRVVRRKLMRKTLNLKNDYGIIVRVKIAKIGSRIVNIAPEYEDCKRIARKKSLPLKMVYDNIKTQALKKVRV